MKTSAIVFVAALALAATASANMRFDPGFEGGVIDAQLRAELATKSTTGAFVKVWGAASLDGAKTLSDKTAKRQFVYDTLTSFAKAKQADLISFLEAHEIKYKSFWIVNSVYIYEADLSLVEELSRRSDVEVIRANRDAQLHVPVSMEPADEKTDLLEWNVAIIGADDAWQMGYDGSGIVVGNIDTGVRYTHESLRDNYRGASSGHDYNWFDPNGNPEPFDNNGHGTHTMGTIAGSTASGIGVAPGATWIAAKGCASSSCSNFDLTSSAEYLACPTRVDGSDPDCSMAPDVINNSWGGGNGDTWYESYILAWRAADIAPIFSQGNSGSSCGSANSPGDNPSAIGVGATDSSDRLATFSSKGPGRLVDLKPEISAPGVAVRSATQVSDSSYSALSGTSMAAPGIAGAYALILQANPNLSIDQIMESMYETAEQNLLAPPGATTCGGLDYDDFPNPIYGYGRVQVDDAINAALRK